MGSEDRRLLAAAAKGDLPVVLAALAAGADVDAVARGTGRTALIEAVIAGHPPVVRALLEAGANREVRCSAVGLTALAWAGGRPRGAESAALLLAAGADLEARQSRVEATPLMWAASSGDLEVVRLLVSAGADLAAVDAFGKSALTRAERHPAVVEALRAAGAEVPPPPAEPAALPWPAVDPSRPDHGDPVALVRGFVLALDAWEAGIVSRVRGATDLGPLLASAATVADPYLTARRRPYLPGSVGTPHRFSADDTLHEVRRPTKTRAELLVRQPQGQPVRAELLFVALFKSGVWLVDAVKQRTLVMESRFHDLLRG